MAVGYNTDGSKAPLYDLGWAGPSGQMYSTVNDLMKVYALYVYVYVRYKEITCSIIRPDIIMDHIQ